MVRPGETTLTEDDLAEVDEPEPVAPVKKKAAATRTRATSSKGRQTRG